MSKDRVCACCGAVKTPQWRSGPAAWGDMSYASLCNTCGVKFRNGRIAPKYVHGPFKHILGDLTPTYVHGSTHPGPVRK